MRARIGVAFVACALLALPLNSCKPTPAAAAVRGGDLVVASVGDTLKATYKYTVGGSVPDSVVVVFSVPNAPNRRMSRTSPPINTMLTIGPALLIPSPPIAAGATAIVSACPVAWLAGTAYAGTCTTRPFTRQVIPPTVTGDSLDVVGIDIFPKGTFASTQSTGACIRSWKPVPTTAETGWPNVWDATTNTWKAVCKGTNGRPMILAFCAAVVMGDSMRVLNAQWTTRPWCAQYKSQVPRLYTMPAGLTSKRQLAAEKAVTKFNGRKSAGMPMTGFSFDEPFGMTIVRDTTTADATMKPYMFGFMVTRSPPGRGGFTMPDSTVFLTSRLSNGDGSPRVGAVVTFTTGRGSGTVAAAASRWAAYGLLERS